MIRNYLSIHLSIAHLEPSLVEAHDEVGDGLVYVDAQPLPERRRQAGARTEQLGEAMPADAPVAVQLCGREGGREEGLELLGRKAAVVGAPGYG